MTVAKVSANKISTIPRQCQPAAITQMVMDGLRCRFGDATWSECGRRLHLLIYLIYIKLTVSVFAICAHVSCSVTLKLAVVAEGTGGQVIAGLTSPFLQLAESYLSISAVSFTDDCHFLIIVPIDFGFYQI